MKVNKGVFLLIVAIWIFFVGFFFTNDVHSVTINLVINGDFEDGNTGFTSDYQYSIYSIAPAGFYGVSDDPGKLHFKAESFGDHTSGKGLMMVVNGDVTPGVLLWSETVTVQEYTEYLFSVWAASWITRPGTEAILQFRINGEVIGSYQLLTLAGSWKEFSTFWNSGTNNSATIEIYDHAIHHGGNDFVMDDIALYGEDEDEDEDEDEVEDEDVVYNF